MLRVHITLN